MVDSRQPPRPPAPSSEDEAWQTELQRGLEHMRAGEFDQAEAYFLRAHQLNPGRPEVCYALGREHLRRGRAAEAELLLRAAWEGDSTLVSAAGTLARCLGLHLDRHAEAHAVLADAEARVGPMAMLHVVRSELYLAQDRIDEARTAANAALDAPGADAAREAASAALARVYNREGILDAERDSYESALFLFKRAADLDPSWSSPQINLGTAFSRLGLSDQAWRAYERAARLEPDNPVAHFNLGVLLRDAGDLEGAREALARAGELEPGSMATVLALADVLLELGEMDAALELVSHAVEVQPDNPDLWSALGGALALTGERDDAEACWRKALELDPYHADACMRLADILTREARFMEAAVLAQRAQERMEREAAASDGAPTAKRP